MIDRLPELGAECRNFLQEAQKIGSRRAANTLALNRHTQLLEILEIPQVNCKPIRAVLKLAKSEVLRNCVQVMDTCVRAGYWEEALELAAHVGKLQRRLAHIPVIQVGILH